MKFNTFKLIESIPPDNQADDSDSSDVSISDDDDDDDDYNSADIITTSDSENDNENDNVNTNTNHGQMPAIPGNSGENLIFNENEEEDETVKAIIRSREMQRNHPPPIQLEDFIVDICFHPNRDMIAVANIMGDVLMYTYNNEETELTSTLELHLKACRDIEFSNDGQTLFSTSKDLSIMLMDVNTEKLIRIYEKAHEQPVYAMTVIGENLFATGDDDGVVKLWDLRQNRDTPVLSIKEVDDYISAMVTNSDNKYLVCASGDGSLTTLNIPARRMHVQSEEYDEELTCLGLFKSETKLLAGSSKGKLYVFNWGEFGLHSDEFPSSTKKSLNCMIPITENIAITAGEDGILRATSLFPHRQLGIVGQHSLSVETLDVNSDGTLIASSSHNNDVKFWNVHYLETLHAAESVKGGKQKQLKHNLPSSKVNNPSDFFADL